MATIFSHESRYRTSASRPYYHRISHVELREPHPSSSSRPTQSGGKTAKASPTLSNPPPPNQPELLKLDCLVQNFLTQSLTSDVRVLKIHHKSLSAARDGFVNYARELLDKLGHGRARIAYFSDEALLIVTLPNLPHEAISGFVDVIKDAMWSSGFYIPALAGNKNNMISGKSAAVDLHCDGKSYRFEPDSSLILDGAEYPFLVCEVANTQSIREVNKKKRPYLLGSRGRIRILIIIKLEMAVPERQKRGHEGDISEQSRKRQKADSQEPHSVKPDNSDSHRIRSGNVSHVSEHMYSRATVSVYSTKLVGSDGMGRKIRGIVTLVNTLEFWPTEPNEALTLSWEDLAISDCPPDMINKTVRVPYTYLNDMLGRFVRKGVKKHVLATFPADGPDVISEPMLSSTSDDQTSDDSRSLSSNHTDSEWIQSSPGSEHDGDEDDGHQRNVVGIAVPVEPSGINPE